MIWWVTESYSAKVEGSNTSLTLYVISVWSKTNLILELCSVTNWKRVPVSQDCRCSRRRRSCCCRVASWGCSWRWRKRRSRLCVSTRKDFLAADDVHGRVESASCSACPEWRKPRIPLWWVWFAEIEIQRTCQVFSWAKSNQISTFKSFILTQFQHCTVCVRDLDWMKQDYYWVLIVVHIVVLNRSIG